MPENRIVITGASSGIGREAAKLLAARGDELILVGRNEFELRSLAKELGDTRTRVVAADLSEPTQVDKLIERSLAAFPEPKLTHLINCAGMAVTGRSEEISTELFEKCWRVNFTAAVRLSQQAAKYFRKTGHGTILNVGSGVARRALPYLSPYCTSKAALHSFNESLRVELMGTDIKAILYSPGAVDTGFHAATVHCGTTRVTIPSQKGISAQAAAKHLVAALDGNKHTVILGRNANLVYHLNYWFPRLVDWIFSRKFHAEPQAAGRPLTSTP